MSDIIRGDLQLIQSGEAILSRIERVEKEELLLDQYARARDAVALVPLPNRTIIDVGGKDRSQFLHNLCTNDVCRLIPGTGCEAFFCNVQGRIQGHVFLFCHESHIRLETVAGQSSALLQHLDKYLIREDVELRDRTGEVIEALIVGRLSTCPAEWQLEGGRYLDHRACTIANSPVTVCQDAIAGEGSALLQFPVDELKSVQTAFVSHGAILADHQMVDVYRTEAGFPFYSIDVTDQFLPQEVCRDELAISLNKGCYLGQETVARIDALGHVNWNLARISVPNVAPPPPRTNVIVDSKEVGHVSSAVYSPTMESALCFARLRREFAVAGQSVTIDGARGTVVPNGG